MSDATAFRSYSWLPVLLVVMTIGALALGGITLHYLETRMIATAGETLALTTAEVSDKLDRFLYERYGDVLLMAGTFSAHSFTREFQSAYIARMKILHPDYLWIGATNARGQIVLATDSATVGRDYSAEPWFQAVRNGRAVHVGDVEPFAATGGVDTVAFTAPIIGPRGDFLGVVTTRVGVPALEHVLTETLQAFQHQMRMGGSLEYQFLTEKGVAFIDSDLAHKGNVNLKQLGLPSALLSEGSLFGYVEEEHLRRHVSVITGYARTQGRGGFEGLHWTVLMRMDRSSVLAPIRTILWSIALAGGVILVPTFGLLVWTAQRVRKEHQLAQEENVRVREAEASLRESEAHARCIVETSLDAFIGLDAAGVITDWNIQAEQMFGWPRQEAIGRLLSAAILPAQHREDHDLRHFLTSGRGLQFNKRIETSGWHREGREFPIELSITPILSNGRHMFSAFVRDISERKLAEARQMRLLTALNASLNEIFMFHTDTLRFTYANRGALNNLGYTLDAMQALTPIDIQPEMTEASFRELVNPLLTGEQTQLIFQTVHLRKNGSRYPVEVHLQVVGQDKEMTFLAFIHDVTARRQQESYQAAEHDVTQLLLESNTLDEAVHAIMKRVCRTLDWDVGIMWRVEEEMQTLRCIEVWDEGHVDCAQFIECSRQSNFAMGIGLPGRVWKSQKVEWIYDVTCDGNFPRASTAVDAGLHGAFAFPIMMDSKGYGVMEFFATAMREPDQKFLDMFHDLTGKLSQFLSRKQAAQCLQQAKDRAEQAAREKAQILATVEAFFIGVTDQGVVSEWTNRAEQHTGILLKDALGQSLRDLPIAWSWDGILAGMRESGDTLMTVRLEKVRLTLPGGKEKFVRLTISPICEDRGIGYVIMGEDVTDRLVLEEDLAQVHKLESIGHLAAGIAHEINTPIQFVGDNVRFLSDSFSNFCGLIEQYQRLLAAAKTGECPESLIETCESTNRVADLEYLLTEIPKALAQTAEGVGRVTTIVRAMKEFSHPGSAEKTAVDLNRAIESTVTVARNEWKYVADLHTNLDPSLPPVPCLVGQFNQVVLNMIVNATHAIADAVKGTSVKGTITISTSLVGDFVEVRIADTGMGIPESIRHKVFDPFFTTKEVGRGTGQGLSLARSVVVGKHGGTITVDSEVGKGTTFLIRLPLNPLSANSVKEGAS